MWRKKLSLFVIGILTIVLIIVSVKYRNLLADTTWQQNNIDTNFKSILGIGASTFPGNSTEVISDIKASVALSDFTTYGKINRDLGSTLNYFCYIIKQDEYKKGLMENSKAIHECLIQISIKPEDKQATDKLNKLMLQIQKTK